MDAPAPAARRRRPILLATLALPVAGWAALAMGAATPFKGLIERRAGAALGREVTIAGPVRVLLTPFSATLSARDVRIAGPAWASEPDLLRAGEVGARLATFDLLIGRPGIRALALRDGRLALERSADGKAAGWASGDPGTLFDLRAVWHIEADRLAVRYLDPAAHSDVRLALSAGRDGATDIRGSGTLAGRAVRLVGSARTGEDRPASLALSGRAAGEAFALEGRAETPFKLGTARLAVSARGGDFARLAELGGIALPAMPRYALSARLDRSTRGWRFSHIEGHVGGTDLAGTLTLDARRARPLVVARLSSRSLDLADARRLFALSPQADAGPFARPRLLPDAPLSAEALQRFDAMVDYRAEAIAGTPRAPAHLVMKLALVRGRLLVSPASVDLAGGFVSSDILVDTRSAPALVRADIRLSPTPMGRLLADWGIAPDGTTAQVKGRIQLTGRGASLREALGNADGRIALVIPAGDVRVEPASASALDMANLGDAIFRGPPGLAPAGLNCGLVAFTVRDGVGTADPILIDTDGHVLSGEGRLDLREETLDLRLEADGKAFGFFARPRPVRLGGTLADPLLMREPLPWFRPAGLFGLRFGLPDLGALLGFVDPDDARAPACGPILRAAPAAAQHERGREIAALR